MNILSIQSEVVFGHVGQGAARFALQRLGHEVWAIPTVLLSSHAGYPHVEGETTSPALMAKLISGLDANGWLSRCDAVLSGYLGEAAQAGVVADAVRRVKAANPRAPYCLDPVFGDNGRAYARPGVAEAMARQLLPLADIVTPNAFELASLTSVAIRDVRDAIVAARRLGRPLVVTKSVPAGGECIGTVAVTSDSAWAAKTSLLKDPPHGAGDLFSAIFLSVQLEESNVENALSRSTAVVYGILETSVQRGAHELALIDAQDSLRSLASGVEISRVE